MNQTTNIPPTRREWTACVRADGSKLPVEKCNAYRAVWGHAPLEITSVAQSQLIVNRDAKPTPAKSCCKPSGPGSELKRLLRELGIPANWCEGCTGRAAQMDRWGITGCVQNRETIRGWMLAGMDSATWWTKAKAAGLAIAHGLMIDPLDTAGWLVDESIRRAEAKTETCCES